MTVPLDPLLAGLLGVGTGVFIALSLLERPVWRLMWAPHSGRVSDAEARQVHAILKRVIHLLPPTMMTTMSLASVGMLALLLRTEWSAAAVGVAVLFFGQLALIAARLFRDIRAVEEVPSEGDVDAVRTGLGALALLHHRGLLMTSSTLIALLAVLAAG